MFNRYPKISTPIIDMDSLEAISAIDGRYRDKVSDLSKFFSEMALHRYRVKTEIEWLLFLSEKEEIDCFPPFSETGKKRLRTVWENFSLEDAKKIRSLESQLKHDVKSVEYFVKEALQQEGHSESLEMVHFLCTSEDINNLSYGMMVREAMQNELFPACFSLLEKLMDLAEKWQSIPMMSRTHGQPASPTTLGKEIFVFAHRLLGVYEKMREVKILGKMNGAVGNYNAHLVVYPEIDWAKLAGEFITGLHLEQNPATTQIEPHDWIVELCRLWTHWNSILLDLNRDLWGYIAMDDLAQSFTAGQVGSSTMPHKINPIQFENSEANLGISNALLEHLAAKLPISRWQRDLSDSSALRNLGTGFAHALLAIKNCSSGLGQIAPNTQNLETRLENAWELLGEAIQSVMRKEGIEKPYEKLKELTRGKKPDQKIIREFIESSGLSAENKKRLMNFSPENYLGNANSLTNQRGFQETKRRLNIAK